MSSTRILLLLLVAAAVLPALPGAQSEASNTTTTSTANATTSTNTSTTNTTAAPAAECPLTDDALAGVDLTTVTGCQDTTDEDFCSACLCSIASALVSGSPTFAALSSSPDAQTPGGLDINGLVEQCAATLGPVLLSALTPDALNTLAACDLNKAAMMCSDDGNSNSPIKASSDLDVVAAQGPVTPGAVAASPARATSAGGVVSVARSAVVLVVPVLLAAVWLL